MNKLTQHARQYRHNDNSGLVHAYEKKGTEVLVSCLEQEIAELNSQIETLRSVASFCDEKFREHHGIDSNEETPLSDALSKTRSQCLQSVKAEAVKEAAFKLADGLLISPSAQREMMEYAMELEGKS